MEANREEMEVREMIGPVAKVGTSSSFEWITNQPSSRSNRVISENYRSSSRLDSRRFSCMTTFDHEKLEVYKTATEFADAAEDVAQNLESGNAHIRDQLRRAAESVIYNTAEGAGEFNPREKARFYRIALRSGTESAAVLHTCLRRELCDIDKIHRTRALLKRVVKMLTSLIKSVSRRAA